MSIEVDCDIKITHNERTYKVIPSVCDEFRQQLDFVRIVFGGIDIATITPRQADKPLEQLAIKHAQSAIDDLVWDDALLIEDDPMVIIQ
jgi:hypothetical protein